MKKPALLVAVKAATLIAIMAASTVASLPATGAPFLDLGLGYALGVDATAGKSCLRDWKKDDRTWGCSENPLGYAAIGYQHQQLSIQFEHWSALREHDAGIDIISVKYRFGGNRNR